MPEPMTTTSNSSPGATASLAYAAAAGFAAAAEFAVVVAAVVAAGVDVGDEADATQHCCVPPRTQCWRGWGNSGQQHVRCCCKWQRRACIGSGSAGTATMQEKLSI